MLAAQGIPPRQIAAAASGARTQGVAVGEYLIGNGYVSAETLYRSVAQHLHVPFLSDELPLRENIDPYAAAKRGIAPIVPDHPGAPRVVVAPRGAGLDRLIAGVHAAKNRRTRFAVAVPARLGEAVRAQCEGTIARAASDALSDLDPAFSANAGPSAGHVAIALTCVTGAVAVGLGFPLLAGIGLAIAFFCAIVLRLSAVAMSFGPSISAPGLPDAELPIYTIIIALYREEAIVGHLLAALERLDYPRAKLDAKIVVEADDVQTIAALRAVRTRFRFEIIVAPPGAPRTKPRALNVALSFAHGALTCVFDAEDEPEPLQLRRSAEIFAKAAPDIGCLQARLVVDNYADNWLTRLYAIDYATLFEVIDPGFANLKLPVPLGGSSNHFRTEALRKVGGWDAWNVTEDADLGLRLARFGYKVATFDSETLEEVPAAIPAFLRQRTRWLKGWMQTMFVNVRNPRRLIRELGFAAASCTALGLGSAIIGALLWPVFALLLILDAAFGPLLAPQSPGQVLNSTLWCFNALFGAAALFGPIAIAMKRQRLQALSPWLPLWPFYQALITLAAWCAVVELWRNPFGWAKTEHGLARSSRSQSIS
jgi:cellulose synthase/poly-beta-1,6-N-acetylglucosamine synthase-like glycosyltransferase